MEKIEYQKKLRELLGKNVLVYVDRQVGYFHKGTTYTQNYGYIKDLIALDGEAQDAYIIGINEPLKEFSGKVIAIIERSDDVEDKLVVSNKDYSDEEIEKYVNFIEKYFKHKIIRY